MGGLVQRGPDLAEGRQRLCVGTQCRCLATGDLKPVSNAERFRDERSVVRDSNEKETHVDLLPHRSSEDSIREGNVRFLSTSGQPCKKLFNTTGGEGECDREVVVIALARAAVIQTLLYGRSVFVA